MYGKALTVLTPISLLIVGYLVFFWLPMESSQGFVQKIMYIHVPSIWLAFVAITVSFIASFGYLWKRSERYDIIAYSSVEIGVVFCGLALITGSIWGKPTWNTYWQWDARLTTTLILFLIFVGYLLLRKFVDYGEQQARYAAIIAIVGFFDIPLIHQSVVWWRTLHQTSTVFSPKKNAIAADLALVLWLSVLAFTFLYLFLLHKRNQLETERRELFKHMAELH